MNTKANKGRKGNGIEFQKNKNSKCLRQYGNQMDKRLPIHRRGKHQIPMFDEILTNIVGMLFHPVFFLILAFFNNEALGATANNPFIPART
jgi:hypothetical protein